ncbi:ROK family protein [Rhodococcus aerolatus]
MSTGPGPRPTPLRTAAELMATQVEDELFTVAPSRRERRRSWARFVRIADGWPEPGPVPVLEVGGTHVTAATVDLAEGTVVAGPVRRDLDGSAAAGELLDALGDAGRALGATHGHWGVAMPSPFDYDTGIGRFTGVGKFDAWNGVDVRAGLVERLAAESVVFLNDADAFGIGECVAGAGAWWGRTVALTLGTGVGSAWVDREVVLASGPEVPPEGRVHLLEVDGRPLEETVSRRALRRAYAERTGEDVDVAEIAARADAGDADAKKVLRRAFEALGRAVNPWIGSFGADVVVVGGSIARSWDRVQPPLQRTTRRVPIVPAARPDDAALIGAAWWVVESTLDEPDEPVLDAADDAAAAAATAEWQAELPPP